MRTATGCATRLNSSRWSDDGLGELLVEYDRSVGHDRSKVRGRGIIVEEKQQNSRISQREDCHVSQFWRYLPRHQKVSIIRNLD